MQIYNSITEWCSARRNIPAQYTLGFVPTMGNLHQGHAKLIEACQKENDRTIVSIFVNPKQFNRADDFSLYPRTLEEDLKLLTHLGVEYCLLPEEESLYTDDYAFQISEHHLSHLMEGACRPGHFTGVLTIVMKLFNLVRPSSAYFGEKDYQQLELIKGMVNAFFMNIRIKPCPTVREASGLPFSSRNNRLNIAERELAHHFAQTFHQPKSSLEEIQQALQTLGIQIEYLEEHAGRRFIAVKIGEIRLLDNVLINT
jgi:pantoate--beta-alanine ligase